MPIVIVSFYCWATGLLLCTFDKNSSRYFFLIYFFRAIYGWLSNGTTLLLDQLIWGISQSGQCSYFEEFEVRCGLLLVWLLSTGFWRVKARQRWSVLIEEMGYLGRNTSTPCALKEILLQHSSPIYFPAALELWNFVVKNAILVKGTHAVCSCWRCRDSLVESQAFFLSSLIMHLLPYFL